MKKDTQYTRLLYLISYILIFMLISYHIDRQLFPGFNTNGFWFYTGLISLLLGSLLVTPYYTNPANALAYAVTAVLALLYTQPNFSSPSYLFALYYSCIIIILSVLSIATNNTTKIYLQNLSFSANILIKNLGNPRVLYFVILLYAIVEFHNDSIKHIIWLIIAGVITIIRLIENIHEIYINLLSRIRDKKNFNSIGKIEAYQMPRIILIRLDDKIKIRNELLLIIKDPTFGVKLGLNLGYTGRDEEILLRALEIEIQSDIKEIINKQGEKLLDNEVAVLNKDFVNKIKDKCDIISNSKSFVGIVDTDSNTQQISIEVINEQEIEEGVLLEVEIKGELIMYQVLDGLTWEDIIIQKNKFGYSKATARKIGKWNKEKNKFELVKWLPQINSPVFICQIDKIDLPVEAIGTFPGTNYFVSIRDMNHLVTHNTAILGILGVGKSYLSFELCERIIFSNIKVVVIDLTNQYETELSGLFIPEEKEKNDNELQTIGLAGRINFQRNVEEGGSINQFRNKIEEQLRNFINQDIIRLSIYNPNRFEVWRQTGGMFNNVAGMASLTPCEITQIVTECILKICQEGGMTDEAKVCLVFEEAHSLIPEHNSVVGENDRHASAGTSRAILQGRKYGLGCLLITQRTANVTKTILNQCNTIFALRTFDETGMSFLSNYFGFDYSRILSSIPEQQAVTFGKASSCENPVLIQLNNRNKFKEIFRAINPLPSLPEWINPESPSEQNEIQGNGVDTLETVENEDLPF